MTSPSDGRYGFDFWQGRWTGRNRKLVDVFDPDCHDWIEFDGECQALSTLGGLGSIDTFVTEMPGRGHFEGMTVRLFNPETSTWKSGGPPLVTRASWAPLSKATGSTTSASSTATKN